MNKETFEKMYSVLLDKDVKMEISDVDFIRNNLEGFSQAMLKIATMELVMVDGVDKDKVEAIMVPLTHVFKLAGANDFMDFSQVADMFKEEGLA